MTVAQASDRVASWDGAFRAHARAELLGRVRVGALLATILVPAGAVLELVVDPGMVRTLLPERLAFGGVSLLIYGATRLPRAVRFAHPLSWLMGLQLAAGVELVLLIGPGVTSSYYAGLSVVIIAVGLLFTWTAVEALAVNLAILAIYVVPALVLPGSAPWRTLFSNAYFLVNCSVLAVAASYIGARLRRRAFYSRLALEARTRELDDASGRLSASLDRLQELDQLKSRFFAHINHELRTPLTLLLAPLEELLGDEDAHLPSAVVARLELMSRSGERLMRLINHLLDITRLQAGRTALRPQAIELASFVGNLVEQFIPLATHRRLDLAFNASAEQSLLADPEKVETIVRNLVGNALKFTPNGGRVRVKLGADGDDAIIEVTDTGVGIPPERLESIFELFSRVEGSPGSGPGGTGIGLALVKELVGLHQGRIEVRSEPGAGSTFRVSLPRGDAADLDGGLTTPSPNYELLQAEGDAGVGDLDLGSLAATATAVPLGRERILVVEDNLELARLLAAFLGRHYRVDTAADGNAGLEAARRLHPDVVVCDVMLPGRSGLEVVEALKTDPRTADIAVILLTASHESATVLEGFARGTDDYMEKPFRPQELLARIRAQLRLRAIAGELAEAQKMAMLGTLAAGLAHEVRNPAGAILASLPVIRRALEPEGDGKRAPSPERVLELVDVVEDSTRRITALVDDLLRFSHVERAAPVPWDPDAAVARVVHLLGHRFEGVKVEEDLCYHSEVEGQGGQLDQVLMNLLDNALKAIGGGGTLRVATHAVDGGVRILVDDDGPGIDPEDLPRIFDPFFTTRGVGDGTGLGLYLSRRIVEAHGGHLEAHNRDGGGARFELWLPGAAGRVAQA